MMDFVGWDDDIPNIVTDTHLERHLENALFFFYVYFYVWNSREPSQLELGKSII